MIGNAAAWRAEYTPPTLRAVAQAVVDRFVGIGWADIGIKGNDAHDGGYHRSIRWCVASRGPGVDYSDQLHRDTSQRSHPTRRNALRGLDIKAPPQILIPMCSRVDWAMRHGLIDDVREWYGNDDGDNRVDGYDNFFNEVVSSDDSHLWHLHLSLFTDTVDGPHDRLIAVLLGSPGWNNLEDDMFEAKDRQKLEAVYSLAFTGGPSCGTEASPPNGRPPSNSLVNKADELLARIGEPAPVVVDADAVADALAGNAQFVAAIAKAVADEAAARLAG